MSASPVRAMVELHRAGPDESGHNQTVMELIHATAHELLGKLNRRELSAQELTRAFLGQIERVDKGVRAFLHVDGDYAIGKAKLVDDKRALGESLGPLAGIPVAVKDVLCTAGRPTTCGSKILENFVPPYDAFVIRKLKEADAVLIGKTNMDEFAMGSSTENSAYHTSRNPWDLERIPGGSSGGSAAAVAASMATLAIGTDTGGSIRQPASLCGIVGMKPTYGRVSRYGMVAFASSLDQIGPFSHDVTDCALLAEAIAGHDPMDSTSVDVPVPPYTKTLDSPLQGLRIGVPREWFGEGLDAEVEASVRAALDVYRKLGAAIHEVSLPHSKFGVAAYYLVATSEASSNLARYDGVHYGYRAKKFEDMIDMYSRSRADGFGTEVKRRIMLGTYALSAGYYDAYYVKALKVRRLIRQDFDRAFQEVDVVVGPTSPTAAFKVGEKTEDPLSMWLSDIYTITANLAGIGGISIPCGFTRGGLPIGLQILAPPFEEERMLRTARMFERETDWHLKRPKV
jgi:aspartyl-tRNA(Asn)/glutamyl-tRNA(Gln) amidotransferase subunit A